MRKPRKDYSPSEKVAILRRHLIDRVPISDLCDEYRLSPTLFYAWQKIFFENGATFVSFLVLQYAGDEAREAGPSDAPTRLADEVRSSAQMFAGHRRPAGFTALQYVEMLRCYGRASRESYENMLRYYEIPSAGTAGTAAGQSVLLGAHAHLGGAAAGSDEGPQSA